MPVELLEHAGRHYAVLFHYALPDDSWRLELSEAVPAPPNWADNPGAGKYLHGPALIAALVPDEDPSLEPTVHLCSLNERFIPYEVMRWFMEYVNAEVQSCRAAMEGSDDAEL
ncbi:hypothetical protein KDL01_39930 [Actinospica durhamensis]|uniref:Uncharacterized protein n=1 Tax=Actinospica durhamensis TaxID=1508375 RepID=A0A941F1L6_9ACTN|nr:hypothetical protein [Actinospica durhamensis]MBR7839494.1 hypothetical protein [Actinospica durhamensis]